MYRNTPYHLVHSSPWPILQSISVFLMLMSVMLFFHKSLSIPLIISIALVVWVMCFLWMRDVVRESCYQGFYVNKSMSNLVYGMVLFIGSEVMFFFSFFWSFFHFSLSPSVELGLSFPPISVQAFDPMSIPLLNTVILLSSGATVTVSHYSLLVGCLEDSIYYLESTFILGFLFMYFQYMEYNNSSFNIMSSSYGTVFFVTTSFHGFHVLVGSLFLLVNYVRMLDGEFYPNHHLSFEFSIWYWHFVDVVWLFLYMFVYTWCMM